MDGDAVAAVAAGAAQALYDAAREHKRLQAKHGREARALMQRLAELRANCARAGIHIPEPTDPRRDSQHG